MRRTLLVLLMLILSAQWTWAAVASVCEHETGKSAVHLGHHEHQHDEAGTAAPDGKAPASADNPAVHADCATCHAGMSALLAAADARPLLIERDARPTPYQRSITHGVPERLIRPPHLSHD